MALVNIEFLFESGNPVELIADEECIPRANQLGAEWKIALSRICLNAIFKANPVVIICNRFGMPLLLLTPWEK